MFTEFVKGKTGKSQSNPKAEALIWTYQNEKGCYTITKVHVRAGCSLNRSFLFEIEVSLSSLMSNVDPG